MVLGMHTITNVEFLVQPETINSSFLEEMLRKLKYLLEFQTTFSLPEISPKFVTRQNELYTN